MPSSGDAAPDVPANQDALRWMSAADDPVTPSPTGGDASATSTDTGVTGTTVPSDTSSGSSTISSPPQSDTISSGSAGQSPAPQAPPVQTALVGGSGNSSVTAPSNTTTSTITTTTGSNASDPAASGSVTAPDTVGATVPAGTQSPTSSTSGQPGSGPGTGGATGTVGATGTGSNGSSGTAVGTTPLTQSDGATSPPAGFIGPTPDPNANTTSGLSPPAPGPWTVTLTDAAVHEITLGLVGGNLQISVNGAVWDTRQPDLVTAISIVGVPDLNDTLTVDLSGGAISVPIFFDGGASGYDTLVVTGTSGAFMSMATGPQSGQVAVGSTVITYAGLEPVNSGGSTNAVFTTTSSADQATLTATGGSVTLAPNNATFESTTISNPTSSLTINLGAGDDSITIGDISGYSGTLTIDGQGDTDTLSITSDSNMSLSGTTLHVAGRDITIQNFESINLTGGAGNNTFAFTDGFGSATVATGGGSDTLDLTGLTGVTHPTDTTFCDAGGDTLTISDPAPDHIDLSLKTTGVGKNFDEATDLTGVVTTLQNVVKSVGDNTSALSTFLPLLDPNAAPSLDRLVKLTSSFADLATAISTSVSSGAISALTSTFTLSQLVGALNSVITGLPSSNPLSGLHFSSAYGRTGSDLVAYLELDMNAPGSCTSTGPGCVATSIPLNLGTLVSGLGLTLTDPTTGKPPAVTVGATMGVHLGIGFDPSTTAAYIDPTGHLNLAASISSSALSATVNIGLLQASISSLPIGPLTGTVGLALPGGSTPIAAGSFSASDVTPTVSANVDSLYTIHLGIDSGVKIGGSDLHGVGADLLISLGDTTDFVNHPSSVPLFGDGGQPPAIHVEVHTSLGGGNDLLNSLNPSEPSFGNADPNTIMSMLSQVASFFGSMASQQFFGTQIPFTTVTLGQLLDYAQQFKHEFLDPLFKSGDSTKPDANGDGKVDLQDFNFSGIQSLLGRLTAALGLGGSGLGGSGGPLSAGYDPATGALTFNFSLTEQAGIGTNVQVTTGAGATVVDAGGSPDVQTIVLNANGGTFTVSYGGSTTAGMNWNDDATTIVQPALRGLPGLSSVTVAGPVNGIYVVTMTGVSTPALLSVDSAKLTDDGLVQTIVVPGNTANFWIGYPDSNGVLGLTDALAKGISDSDLATALNGLSGVQPGSVSINSAAGTTSTAYRVRLTGSPSAGTKAFAAAGGLSLAFGAGLGGLASLQTTGSVIPLARLVAEGTFGINLNSSTSISVGPSAFQNGPQASVTTVQQGGKGITVTKVRQGLAGQVDAVWLVTVKGGGHFTLSSGANTTGNLTPGSDITSDVVGLHGGWSLSNVHVSISHQPEGIVYTIDFDKSVAPVSDLSGDGSGLTGQNEKDELQVQNANGGQFNLIFNGGTLAEDHNVSAATLGGTTSAGLNNPSFTAVATVPNSSTPGSVTVTTSGGAIEIEFTGGWAGMDVSDMSTDSTNLTGTLDTASHPGNGTLTGNATFDAEITDGPAVQTQITQNGVAAVTTSTIQDGGIGLAINTTTPGGASVHEVQTLNVRASAGMFTLTSGGGSATIAIDASLDPTSLASAVQSALATRSVNATVTGAQTVGGKLLTITFTATGDQPQLVPTTTTAFTGVNEVQTVTVSGAVSGTYTLTYNGTPSTAIHFNNDNLASTVATLVGAGSVSVSPSGNVYTITFDGSGVAGTNVKPLNPGTNSLGAQNEIQTITLLNATGGTFTLTTSNGTTTSTATGIAYNSALDSTAMPTLPSAAQASGGTLAAGTYYYMVTAITAAGEGVASAEVHASTDATHGTISLSWTAPASPSSPVTDYRIYRGVSAGAENVFFASAGTGTTFSDTGGTPGGSGTPPTTDLTTKLSNMPALGLGAHEVTVTGSPGAWTITFNGADTAGKHFDKFVGDAGGLLNSQTLPPLSVTLLASSTGTDLNHDGTVDQNDVVVALQTALDAAAVTAGITPGFLTAAITGGGAAFTGGTFFAHSATDDTAFEIMVPLTAHQNTITSGTLAVTGTTGNFTITIGGLMTTPIAIGSGASVVQSAITQLSGFTDTVTVTLSGSTYTLSFGTTHFSTLSGAILLPGSIPLASEDTIGHFETALQSQIQSLLQGAGISGGSNITVGDASSHTELTISSTTLTFGLMFQEPIVASVGGGRISLTAPQVLKTANTSLPSVSISRGVNVDVKSYDDPSFQVLGLATSPTRLNYGTAPSTEIDFTLFVNDATIPIAILSSDLSNVHDIAALVTVLQAHVDSALADAFNGGALTAAAQIEVCRPNINPAAGACDDVGNRITFMAVSGVTSLSIDVPAKLADGTTDNGAVTELGFQALTGATSHSRAGRFFLDNVHLTGTVELVLQDVSATASLGFLGLTGTATGTLPEQRLLSLTADIRLRNPLVTDSDGCGCQNLLDIGTLINAIRDGHFLYKSDDVHGGSAQDPPTGFFKGTLSGGFGGDLNIVPAGVLSGLTGVSADLMFTATSDDWFSHIPTPDIHFAGPDFQSILSRFQSLDYGSITQALLLIVNFVKGLNQPGTPIGDVLSAPLPLINQSLGDLLNIASDIATKIQAIVTNPAGAIQQLNNILANALGLPTPSVAVQDLGLNGSSQDQQKVTLNADAGTFTFSFTPGGGGSPQTSVPIPRGAAASVVQSALNKLKGVNVTVTKDVSGFYTVTFVPTGTQPLFTVDTSELARGPPVVVWNNGEIDFTFDLGASTQISKPFDLSLSSVLGNGALASIANALIGAGASGSLSVNLNADLHVVLGLDLSSPATVGGSGGTQTVKLNATGGSFTISYQAPVSPPQNVVATAQTGGSLAAGTYYYEVTAVTSSGETVASAETGPTTADSTNKTVSLTWDAVAGALSYRIYRGTSSTGESPATSRRAPRASPTTAQPDSRVARRRRRPRRPPRPRRPATSPTPRARATRRTRAPRRPRCRRSAASRARSTSRTTARRRRSRSRSTARSARPRL